MGIALSSDDISSIIQFLAICPANMPKRFEVEKATLSNFRLKTTQNFLHVRNVGRT